YIDQGQHYLLDADYLRALPYLAAAYADGDRSNALRFMLHRAMALASAPVFRHTGLGHVAAFRRGDREVMSIGEDGDAAIWDAATGGPLRALAGPRDRTPYATAGAITGDGELAAILARDVVWLWDGATVRTLPVAGARRLAFDAAGRRLALSSR